MSRSRQGGRNVRMAALAALAVIAATAVGGPVPAPVEAETTPSVRVLGVLQKPPGADKTSVMGVLGFEPDAHRMYVWYSDMDQNAYLATYDTRSAIPTRVSTRNAPGTGVPLSPYLAALDLGHRRAYRFINVEGAGALRDIGAVSLDDDGTEPTTFSLVHTLPGFAPTGMTYSAADDRLYLVGEMSVAPIVADGTQYAGNKPASVLVTVVALDPDNGSLLWVRQLPECQQQLNTKFVGSLIARSATLAIPTLFVPCIAGNGYQSHAYPGQSGLLALEITPTAGMVTAQEFAVRYHPISGIYWNGADHGVAAHDPSADRVFMQSLSWTTPGAWVFDGRLGGWVGRITAPQNSNFRGGVNPGTGRYYMGGNFGGRPGFLLIADGRATPPQQGVELGSKFSPTTYIAADPGSNRFFLAPDADSKSLYVIEDLTLSAPPNDAVDYDALTDDIAETTDTYVSFGGDTGGFGARMAYVGGVAGPYSKPSKVGWGDKPPNYHVSGTTRALVLATSPAGVSVGTSSATASAEAGAVDPGTRHDLHSNTIDLNGDDDPAKPETKDDNVEVHWPHAAETCADGGEGVDNPPEKTREGFAGVTCNLKGHEATAKATYTATATSDSTVGRTSYESKVKRTVKDGVRTDTTSFASGIHVDVPGVGTLDIGRVTATATTIAHGRRGTAKATWTRVVDDVTVRDLTGKPLVHEPGCTTVIEHDGTSPQPKVDDRHTSCEAIAEAVRRALQVRVKLAFPEPDVVATSKGAFAGVTQADTDYYREITVNNQGTTFADDKITKRTMPGLQLDVYDDGPERSRLVVQLAAVENTSFFYVTSSLDDPPCDSGGCIPGGDSGEFADLGSDAVDAAADFGAGDIALGGLAEPTLDSPNRLPARRGGAHRTGEAVAVGLAVARRGFGQGALMTSLLLLVTAAAGSVHRRRRLLGSLASP